MPPAIPRRKTSTMKNVHIALNLHGVLNIAMERPSYTAEIFAPSASIQSPGFWGPRQCGKPTLARQFARVRENSPQDSVAYVDLENPRHQAGLEDSLLALEPLRGRVIIDEIQRAPGLFEVLRVLVDRRPLPARFLILGSAPVTLSGKALNPWPD